MTPAATPTVAASARAAPTLDALLAARTVWHAGRSAGAGADAQSTGHEALDALLPQGGWPRGALTELLLPADGIGELSLLLPTLARLTGAGETVVLVAPPYVPYAPAWQAAGVELACLQVVEASPRDAAWAFEQCLRSGACAAVLGWPAGADAQTLRRLQVAADSGACLGFALRDRRHAANPSPAALRIEARCGADARGERGRTEWAVRKCRGGNPPAQAFVMPQAGVQPADAVAHDATAGDRAQARLGMPLHASAMRTDDAPSRHRHARQHASVEGGPAANAVADEAGAQGHRAQVPPRTPRLAYVAQPACRPAPDPLCMQHGQAPGESAAMPALPSHTLRAFHGDGPCPAHAHPARASQAPCAGSD